MKQNITEEQWLEVCRKGPKYAVCYEGGSIDMEQMNIGGMIEFLGECWMDNLFRTSMALQCDTRITFDMLDLPGYDEAGYYELTDALWEACKNKLNQTKNE